MPLPRYVIINGQRVLWRDVLKLRREQRHQPKQPTLFPLRDDARPQSERTATGRYREPSFFAFLETQPPKPSRR